MDASSVASATSSRAAAHLGREDAAIVVVGTRPPLLLPLLFLGIEHIAKNEALTLSGGEKRRLTIARSLVTNPSLLMLDEPFSGVDPIAVHDVQQIIQDLRSQGLAILITDHNVRETLNIVDRAYLIFEGRVESQGNKEFLLNDPISRKLYLGESFSM